MNYIFSINSGRAGSKYLASLLKEAEDTDAFHEAPPVMANEHLLGLVHSQLYPASYQTRQKKVAAIQKVARSSNYVETNHMFIKTFFDVVVDAFAPDVKVILLRRHIPAVVKSFVELEYFGKNAESFKWMTRSDAKTRSIEPLSSFNQLDIFDRTISYLIDIEARAERFQREYPDIPVVEVRLDQLNDLAFVESLFSNLGLKAKNTLSDLVNVRVNQKENRKKQFQREVSFQEACDRVDSYLRRAKAQGIDIPKGLYL